MANKAKPTTLDKYEEYTFEALILENRAIGEWFVDICIGRQPETSISEEILALMQARGLIRETNYGWVLGSEGRIFALNLGLISGPSDVEVNPSLAIAKSKIKLNNIESIERVWQDFFATRSEDSRNALMNYYLSLAKHTASRIVAKLPGKVEFDDLMSAGIFGLKDAIEAFNPERGVKFETYCTQRIRESILDELRNMDWAPRLVRARSARLEKTLQTLEAKLNKKINIIEGQQSQSPDFEAKKLALKDVLTRELNRTEKMIIILYYYEEMTIKEIAAMLDLSESRVSQMHASIIARLKIYLENIK